jgi:prevent-host-death family protein
MAKHVPVSDLKATLSEQIARVKSGEEILVTERGVPVARITPYRVAFDEERLSRLARAGVVRLPERRPGRSWKKPAPVKDRNGSVLRALLEDRDEGR